MINIILTVVLGALAGVTAFLSCAAIWNFNPLAQLFSKNKKKSESATVTEEPESYDLSEGAIMQLSVNIRQQELALTKEGTTVTGSYINIERNRDGMQTCNKIFLN
ncbi:MAG: hypothetical protein R3222_10895 [Balneolaceae bacterium]|nr:hypothetical protein [Balneolaceae bacterium]